jgi:hypothetical protein
MAMAVDHSQLHNLSIMYEAFSELAEEPDPAICIFILVYACMGTHQLFEKGQKDEHIKSQLDLNRDAIMRWTCLPRTSQDLDRLCRGSVCTCDAGLQSHPGHQYGQRMFRESGYIWPACLLMFVAVRLIDVSFGVLDSLDYPRPFKARSHTRRAHWPTEVNQVLPYGSESTARGLLAWLNVDYGAGNCPLPALRLLSHVLSLTFPVTLPFVTTSDTFIHQGIITSLKRGCDPIEESWRRGGLKVDLYAAAVLRTCAQLLHYLLSWTDSVQRRKMIGSRGAVALASALVRSSALARRTHAYPSLDPAAMLLPVADMLDSFARQLARDFPELQTLNRPQEVGSLSRAEGTSWTMFLFAIVRARLVDTCASPECSNAMTLHPQFKQCGGCRRVIYCSRDCQKIAWDHTQVPHRRICSMLRQICMQSNVRRTITPSHATTISETPSSFNPDDGLLVVKHLELQTSYELQTLCTSII